ncbi:MAG: hypothetical protein ICV85_05110 [Tolypothrix sp. T3-bin4]|nr:hypothetical protein [Tolypothrix sp. T3-bin4]
MVIFDLEHLEDVKEENLVRGGDSIPSAQFAGGSTGVVVGAAINGGSLDTGSRSSSFLDGNIGAFTVLFGSEIFSSSRPF